MTPYKNSSGRSGIESYEIADDSITIRFREGKDRNYLYTNKIPGIAIVEKMKVLAVKGQGLNSYISSNRKLSYEHKW